MAIIFVLLAFFLCWIWIELTIFLINRFNKSNTSNNINNKFIWYLRFISLVLLAISYIYMHFFQKADLEKAIQYCLGIIK